jgi:hypothetical protein
MLKILMHNSTIVLVFCLINFVFFSSAAAQFLNETNRDDNPSKLKKMQLTELKIVPDDLNQYDRFGHSVDMDGDYSIIGAYGKNKSSGVAYIFKHGTTGWEQKAKLTLNQAENEDLLGYTVAISGDVALVSGRGRESVYIFEKPEGEWQDATETARLYPSETFSYLSYFGDALDISGDYVMAGDWQSQVVYVYEKPADGWKDTTESLILSPPATAGGFGHAIAIDGNYAVLGAYLYSGDGPQSGGAFIYKRDSTWEYQSVIRPSDGADGNRFGLAVGIDANRIVVGAPSKGQAYVYRRDNEIWNEEDILERFSNYQIDFGMGLDIFGDTVIVGSYLDKEWADNAGSASIFCRNASDWIHVNRIIPGDFHDDGYFGFSIALTKDYALVGSYGSNGDSLLAGQAYIYSDYTVPATSINEKNDNITENFYLAQNYPNPFNPETVISWQLPVSSYVELGIYNIMGQKLCTLVSEKQEAGQHSVEWDASGFPSGVYFYQIRTKSGYINTKKLVLIK